jgi:hypothetical protein
MDAIECQAFYMYNMGAKILNACCFLFSSLQSHEKDVAKVVVVS